MPFDQLTYQSTDPVLKCLQDARQWVARAWWSPGKADNGSACASNALAFAARDAGFVFSIEDDARRLLARPILNGLSADLCCSVIFNYNDDPTTTHADILALFDRAIAARLAEVMEHA